MRKEAVEIYSDQTNTAVLRHPDRRFPGVLIQGDSLYRICVQADDACLAAKDQFGSDEYANLNQLRNSLWTYLNHYKNILSEHQIPLPFNEESSA